VNILVCIKRVPMTGAKIILTDDAQAVETRHLGFTFSPHEECAVEEAVRLLERHGGTGTVLTLGSKESDEQLRYALSMGMQEAILLETDAEWGPMATANAIIEAIKASGKTFDVLMFGNEAADTGGYQVGIRVAQALDLPCVTGIKGLELNGNTVLAKKEISGGHEVYEVTLPAVFTVKEGLNYPRYPSVPGRMRAKKVAINTTKPTPVQEGLSKVQLRVPVEEASQVEILGQGASAAPKVVELFKSLGLLA
jgi:electron transfer flavoprotein beta subunit